VSYWCGFNNAAGKAARGEPGGIDSINMTSNVAPMWRLAGADLAAMNGMDTVRARIMLAGAVHAMLLRPEDFKKLNPENGWGDYEGTVQYLMKLCIMASEVEPDDTFYANH